MSIKTVNHLELRELTLKKLTDAGVSEEEANIVTNVLLHANLRGIDSHGILRLEHYIRRIKAGGINPKPKMSSTPRGLAAAVFDGDDGLGHLVAKKAMDCALEIAANSGVALVSAINSSHCGALSYYVEQAVKKGFIGIAATNTDKMVVPHGGTKPFFGTNPFAFGFPALKNKPVIIDMATSIIAMGKILQAKETGQTIPDNCAVDENGECTILPDEFVALLPFGGAKGYGISMIVDIFSGVLTGTSFGPHVNIMYGNYNEKRKLGHFLAAIDPGIFIEKEEYYKAIDQLIDELHAVPPAAGYKKVMVPGDPEHEMEEKRLTEGVPVAESIYNFLIG